MSKRRNVKVIASILMVFVALGFLYPFFWMFLGSFKTNQELYDTQVFWPKEWSFGFYGNLLSGEYFDFWGSLWNSVFISGVQSLGATFIASLAGYSIARRQFAGRGLTIAIGVALVVIPAQVISLPLFMWINRIGAFDTAWGVILPGLASGLGFLFFVRVYQLLPQNLMDAGRMEGASEWKLYCLTLGLVKPFLAAFAFLQFVLIWHAHIVPLLILNSDDERTLPLSLAALSSNSSHTPEAVIMAAAVIGMLPLIAVFGIAYPQLKSALKDFVSG